MSQSLQERLNKSNTTEGKLAEALGYISELQYRAECVSDFWQKVDHAKPVNPADWIVFVSFMRKLSDFLESK